MLNCNKIIIIMVVLTCVTACAGFKESMKSFEDTMNGRNSDEEKASRAKREATNAANAEGFNFHNYDVIGFETGVSSEVVDSFIQKNAPSTHSRTGFKGEYSSKLAYREGHYETVVIGTTGAAEHNVAYYITRIKQYNPHLSGPIKQNFTKQLFDKYGPPTIVFTEEPDTIFGIGEQKYYVNEYGMKVPEALVTEYYWQFDKNGNLKPKDEELSHLDHKFFSTDQYKLLTSDTRKYLTYTEMIRPPRQTADEIFNKFHIVRCSDNCGFQLTAAVITRRSNSADRVIRYSITLADMSLLGDATAKSKENYKKRMEDDLRKSRKKNTQIDL